jgi:hypothetical protein
MGNQQAMFYARFYAAINEDLNGRPEEAKKFMRMAAGERVVEESDGRPRLHGSGRAAAARGDGERAARRTAGR